MFSQGPWPLAMEAEGSWSHEDYDDVRRHRWWESIMTVTSEFEQKQPFKIATACSGIESPIIAAKAEVICASFKVL